jgi:serine/threonine protein kinase
MSDREIGSLFLDQTDEDLEYSHIAEGEFEIVEMREPIRLAPRKIQKNEIPAGHAEVEKRDRSTAPSLEFDVDDPNSFIGRLVKGRYRVLELIGEDDAGAEYLAEDRIVEGKRVIVRVLEKNDYEDDVEAVLKEERVSLSHMALPNIIRLIDSGEFVNGTTFLISEFNDALSVAEIMQIHGSLPPLRVAKIIRDAGYALTDVHNQRILHRDLRPEYILLSDIENGSEYVKLSNFGVSDGEPNAENLAYRASEILHGEDPTVLSDIYSLGVIAFRMLTGQMPFAGNTVKEILRSQMAGLKLRPSGTSADVPAAIDGVFDKVLATDPSDRYPTARDFGDALFNAVTRRRETQPVVVVPTDVSPVEEAKLKAPRKVTASSDKMEPPRTSRASVQSTEPPSDWTRFAAGAFATLVVISAIIWFLLEGLPALQNMKADQPNAPATAAVPDSKSTGEVPPATRTVIQPANTTLYQNDRAKLTGDLNRNFLGFSIFYPNNWKVAGPQPSTDGKLRGKFLDVSGATPDGDLTEQMLISYFPSNGTYNEDTAKFTEMVAETNETLRDLIPNYHMVSEGETRLNGDWRAYEVRFEGSGSDGKGGRLDVWGRRLFVPAARPGIRSGFSITMLATSNSKDVHSVEDVGAKGDLAPILGTFEPDSNF